MPKNLRQRLVGGVTAVSLGLTGLLGAGMISGGCMSTQETRSDAPHAVLAYRANDFTADYKRVRNALLIDGQISREEAENLLKKIPEVIIANQQFRNYCMSNQQAILYGQTMDYFLRITQPAEANIENFTNEYAKFKDFLRTNEEKAIPNLVESLINPLMIDPELKRGEKIYRF
ncbi:hypothetical protein J4447_00730 [Candidatus Pacearchaeota archaeon]|nr:hypothetical protein [Candidatus Pacearchaeota archaeon]